MRTQRVNQYLTSRPPFTRPASRRPPAVDGSYRQAEHRRLPPPRAAAGRQQSRRASDGSERIRAPWQTRQKSNRPRHREKLLITRQCPDIFRADIESGATPAARQRFAVLLRLAYQQIARSAENASVHVLLLPRWRPREGRACATESAAETPTASI